MGFVDGEYCRFGEVFFEGEVGGETADSGAYDDDFHDVEFGQLTVRVKLISVLIVGMHG